MVGPIFNPFFLNDPHLILNTFYQLKTEPNKIQGNRGDMRKIHVTWQFFEASGRHGDLIEKTKFLYLPELDQDWSPHLHTVKSWKQV